jgi:hypothetical protein
MFCFFFRGVMEELEAEGMKFQCSVEKCGMKYKTRLGCQKHGNLKHPPADNFTVIDLQSQQVAPESVSSDTRDNRGRFASSAVVSRSSSSSPIVESPAAAERRQELQRVREDVAILEQVELGSLQPSAPSAPSARAAAVHVASDSDEELPAALISSSKSRCSACQQTGHISSNRSCPVKIRHRMQRGEESMPSVS